MGVEWRTKIREQDQHIGIRSTLRQVYRRSPKPRLTWRVLGRVTATAVSAHTACVETSVPSADSWPCIHSRAQTTGDLRVGAWPHSSVTILASTRLYSRHTEPLTYR